jgi:hypothetical protein
MQWFCAGEHVGGVQWFSVAVVSEMVVARAGSLNV